MRQLKKGRNVAFKAPKKDSKGHVPLNSNVVTEMKKWKAEGWERYQGRAPIDADPVFPKQGGAFGRIVQASQFRDDLHLAGLPTFHTTDEGKKVPYTFHNGTRSTFVSALNALRVDENDRQALMRHSKKGVTNQSYTTDDMGRLREGVERLPL
jgi:hypothetical protein